MRRRLTLESLETRITPTSLGTLSFDAEHLTVAYTPASASTTTTTSPSTSGQPAGSIALQPSSGASPTGLIANLGSLSGTNMSDTYFIANAVQGTSLTVALEGTGQMSLSVVGQNGIVLAQQTGQGAVSLTLTNLPATGGVTVVVTGTVPTGYLLASQLTGTPTGSGTTTTSPSVSAPVTTQTNTLTNGVGLPLIDPDGLGDADTVNPDPFAQIQWEWASIGNIQLYDPVGQPFSPWSPSIIPVTSTTGTTTPPPTTTTTTPPTTTTTTTMPPITSTTTVTAPPPPPIPT